VPGRGGGGDGDVTVGPACPGLFAQVARLAQSLPIVQAGGPAVAERDDVPDRCVAPRGAAGLVPRWAFSFASVRALANTVGQPVPGQWYHLVGVRDVTNSKLSIYVDGTLSGSVGILGGGDKGTGNLEVGRGKFNSNPVDYLNGSVDNAQVFDRALTAADVSALHAGGPGQEQLFLIWVWNWSGCGGMWNLGWLAGQVLTRRKPVVPTTRTAT